MLPLDSAPPWRPEFSTCEVSMARLLLSSHEEEQEIPFPRTSSHRARTPLRVLHIQTSRNQAKEGQPLRVIALTLRRLRAPSYPLAAARYRQSRVTNLVLPIGRLGT